MVTCTGESVTLETRSRDPRHLLSCPSEQGSLSTPSRECAPPLPPPPPVICAPGTTYLKQPRPHPGRRGMRRRLQVAVSQQEREVLHACACTGTICCVCSCRLFLLRRQQLQHAANGALAAQASRRFDGDVLGSVVTTVRVLKA